MPAEVDFPRRRRLSDLYVRGQEVELGDDNEDEDPVVVWVHKISPLENKQAMDQANAIRARLMASRFVRDESEVRLTIFSEAEMAGLFVDRNRMIDYVKDAEVTQARMTIEAQLADDEEWSKNDYLEGLRESWNGEGADGGMRKRYAMDPEDPEAKAVFDELKRYVEKVEELLERERKRFRREEDRTTDQELRNMVVDRLIESEADNVWYGEFRKRQLFYAIREPEAHDQRYFSQVEELDMLDEKVVAMLLDKFDEVNVSPAEGKD